MRVINPYESPQSDVSPPRQPVRKDDLEYPAWINTALNGQYSLIFVLFILALFIGGPPDSIDLPKILAIAAIIAFAGLTVLLFVAAVSYKVRWLFFSELFVMLGIGLPFLGWL